MFWVDTAILVGSVLLLLGVLSNKFSSRLGMPALVTFLGLGMLAGSEGLGGIDFEDYSLSYTIGTVVLALILFAGGLGTPLAAVRSVWLPAGLLATLGVFLTAIMTGLAASWILGIPLGQGLLLGSIVGSTDASAVFSILRASGIHIRKSLADTLEVESGSNDPMAIFMTIGLIQYLAGNLESKTGLALLFLGQMGIGLAVGLVVGFIAVGALRKIRLDVAGLYPILAMSFGMMSYGIAADFGGSGFLATFLTGVVIGNHRLPFERGIQAFHDAIAWLGQIVMFVVLGLLSFPSRLLDVFWAGLAITAVLAFFSRPIAVFLCLARSRFTAREKLLLSWVGLKGAVPITLAIFPLMSKIDGAPAIFDIVFFVVLFSAVIQGSTLKWFAKLLNLNVTPKQQPPITLELSSLHEVDADIVDYYIEDNSLVAGKTIRDLALPYDVVIALIVREHQSKLPKGGFQVQSGDHVIVVVHRYVRPAVDRIFSRTRTLTDRVPLPLDLEIPLRGVVTLANLSEAYGVELEGPPGASLDEWLRNQIPKEQLVCDAVWEQDEVRFYVREISSESRITLVGMVFFEQRNEAITTGDGIHEEDLDAIRETSKSKAEIMENPGDKISR